MGRKRSNKTGQCLCLHNEIISELKLNTESCYFDSQR